VIKILSSTVVAFGGGAIGREGPTVQISASVFYLVHSCKPSSWPGYSERVVIMTGSAAGLAAAFNTPLGGIVFAIEELSRLHFSSFRTTLLGAVIVAGFTAQSILGPYLFLGYPRVGSSSLALGAAVLVVAMAAGIAGAVFSRLVFASLQALRRIESARQQFFVTVVLALALASLAHFYSMKVLGSGKETMVSILFGTGAEIENSTVVARFFGPILTFAAGAAGGIFAPALSAGATIGAYLAPHFTTAAEQVNVLVLAGMVGFLTAITRSPFTSAVLVLEMTDRHSVIFFLMLAGLTSYAAARLINQHSLYERLKPAYLRHALEHTR
jgi:H+/Cl- antiporter ClcA